VKITIAEIARRAGVSKTTVSRVLNNRPYVDKVTRRKIRRIIAETGYTPHAAAVSLATGRNSLVGLLSPSLHQPWTIEIIQGIAEAIDSTEYELVLYTTTMAERNQETYARALTNGLTDGLIVILPRADGMNYLADLRRHLFPVVLIDYRGLSSDLPSVTATNFAGACSAVDHLIELGHRCIGMITGLMDLGCSRDRLAGYRHTLEQAGLVFEPSLVVPGDFSELSGCEAMNRLLSLPEPPTAVFASNDEMAFGAMRALKGHGLCVPDDVSLVGFDDVPMAQYTSPPLTTVRQPMRDMGCQAVEMLLTQIRRDRLEQPGVVVPTRLIVRESSGSPRL
jgi:LacI family transcriptional regulator